MRLQSFVVAARLQSFALAAQELNLTASAVSHQMRGLEQHFGRALFQRRHRRVQTTLEGQRLQQSLERVFEALQAACAEVALAPKDQVLAVHCSPSLAIKWLGPQLPSFLAKHPAINVRLTTGAAVLDLAQLSEVDVTLSYGVPPPARAGIETTALGQERIAPLVSRAKLPPRARAAQVLQQMTLIDSSLSPVSWANWFEHQGLPLPGQPRPAFDRAAMAISAAADGLGIALESTRLAARELERGELVVLGERSFKPLLRAMHFVSARKSDLAGPTVKAFVSWMLELSGDAGHAQGKILRR